MKASAMIIGILLVSGCSSDPQETAGLIKAFSDACESEIHATLTYGTWNRSLELSCKFKRDKTND